MDRNTEPDESIGTGPVEVEGGGGGLISIRNLKTFDALRNPVYRLYYGAMAGQWIAMNMQMVTRSLLVYRITGSGAILGGVSLANAVPLLLLAFFGGAIADRVQKKYILLISQTGSAVISLSLAILLTTGYLGLERPDSWWILIVAAMLQGTIMGFMMPSRQAIIPEIVSREKIMNAISLNVMGMNFFQIISPALAGFFIDTFSFAFVYYVITAGSVMATIFVAFMPHTRTLTARASSTISDIVLGMKYIRRETAILMVVAFGLCSMIFTHPYRFLMPMVTEDVLKVGATELGLLMTAAGIGAIMGSITLATLPNRKRGATLLTNGVLMGIVLAVFAFSHWWHFSLIIIVFVGVGQSFQMTLGNSLIQYYVDDNYRGRVMSFNMMGIGLASFGTFFGGILAERVGVQWSIGGLAMCLTFISILALIFVPRLRRLE